VPGEIAGECKAGGCLDLAGEEGGRRGAEEIARLGAFLNSDAVMLLRERIQRHGLQM
jgi:hypothetical protein